MKNKKKNNTATKKTSQRFIVYKKSKFNTRHKINDAENLYFFIVDKILKVRKTARLYQEANNRPGNYAPKRIVDEADLSTDPVTPHTVITRQVAFTLFSFKQLKCINDKKLKDLPLKKETTVRDITSFFFKKQTTSIFPLRKKTKIQK